MRVTIELAGKEKRRRPLSEEGEAEKWKSGRGDSMGIPWWDPSCIIREYGPTRGSQCWRHQRRNTAGAKWDPSPPNLATTQASQGQSPLCCPHPGSPACGLTVDMPKIWAHGFCSTAQGSCRLKGALDPRQGSAPIPIPGLEAG